MLLVMKCLLLGMAVALAASVAHAQVQITDAIGPTEYQSLLGQISSAVEQIEDVKQKKQLLDRHIADFSRRRDIHQQRQCVCYENHPCPCRDPYNAEKRALEIEQQQLIAQEQALKQQVRVSVSHYNIIMGRLRIAAFLDCLKPFRDNIVSCSNIDDEMAAEVCLKNVWANACY